MYRVQALVAVLGFTAAFAMSVRAETAPVTAVDHVDLDRYLGLWFDIGHLPNKLQEECVRDATATYSRRGPTVLNVSNVCFNAAGGEERNEGIARIRDLNTNAKLEVRFAPLALAWLPFVWNDYWLLDLAPDYSYALVGEPGREALWVLARKPQLDSAIYERLLAKATAQGFDVSKIQRTVHTPGH